MARMKSNFEFMAGMHFGGELYFNRYSLIIDFYTLSGTAQDQNIAMDRISYFIYDTVARSIFIDENETAKIKLLDKASLTLLTVPEPGPFDPVILAALVTKMNSILEDILVITDAELVSEFSGAITYTWDSSDDDDEIHQVVNNTDETKWWSSPLPRFVSYPADTDVDTFEETQPFPLTWEMLDLGWADDDDDDPTFIVDVVSTPTGKGNKGTVIKADFTAGDKKPTKPAKPKK